MSDYSPAGGGTPNLTSGARSGGTDWMRAAWQAFADGDAQRALYAAREALAQDGSITDAWAIRARSNLVLKHYSDAEFEAREALRLAPHVAANHETLAEVYEAQERYKEATRVAQEAVNLAPSEPSGRLVLGRVLLRSGSARDAVTTFERLVKEVPGEPLYRRYLALSLDQAAYLQWTQVPDGDRVITSAEQASLTRTYAQRGLALEFNDDEVRSELRKSLAAADQAETKRWMHSRPIQLRVYVGTVIALALFGLLCLGAGTAGTVGVGLFTFLIMAAIIAIYVVRHRKFAWEHDAETARQLIRGR